MVASIHEILNVRQTTAVVSQTAATSSELLSLFGMSFVTNPETREVSNGPNVRETDLRTTAWDIYNDVRTVARMRAPGTPSAIVARNKVGRESAQIPRTSQHVRLLSEELYRYRRLGGHGGEIDTRGEEYIRRQLITLGQQAANWRTALLAGMLRDSLHIAIDGDDEFLVFDPASVALPTRQINFRIPAGNKSSAIPGLDPLGTGDIITASWATAATDIPGDLTAINAAMQELTGHRLELIITTSRVWNAVLQNTAVRNLAGTSNTPFETFQRKLPATDPAGNPINSFVGRLRGMPWVEWLITDEILKVGPTGSESSVKLIDDDGTDAFAWFGPQPDSNWTEMHIGGEPVSDGFGMAEEFRFGLYSWTKQLDDPAGHQLMMVDNALPVLYVPAATMYAKVI